MQVNTLAVAPSTCEELLWVFCMGTLCSSAGVKEQFPSSVFNSETGSIHRQYKLTQVIISKLLFELNMQNV